MYHLRKTEPAEKQHFKERLLTKLQILEQHVLDKKCMPGIDVVLSAQEWEAFTHDFISISPLFRN